MRSVLIVEDDLIFAQSIEAHLVNEGFEVEVAASTFTALDRLDARKFGMLLVDIGMPRGAPSGLSFARMARIRNPQAHIIFLTGYPELVKHAEQFGAKVFAKPIDLAAVAAEIDRQLTA
jgi:DNA-binding response OmpR family regulator